MTGPRVWFSSLYSSFLGLVSKSPRQDNTSLSPELIPGVPFYNADHDFTGLRDTRIKFFLVGGATIDARRVKDFTGELLAVQLEDETPRIYRPIGCVALQPQPWMKVSWYHVPHKPLLFGVAQIECHIHTPDLAPLTIYWDAAVAPDDFGRPCRRSRPVLPGLGVDFEGTLLHFNHFERVALGGGNGCLIPYQRDQPVTGIVEVVLIWDKSISAVEIPKAFRYHSGTARYFVSEVEFAPVTCHEGWYVLKCKSVDNGSGELESGTTIWLAPINRAHSLS